MFAAFGALVSRAGRHVAFGHGGVTPTLPALSLPKGQPRGPRGYVCCAALVLLLELGELGFELPLLPRARVGGEEIFAGRGWLFGACRISRASLSCAKY